MSLKRHLAVLKDAWKDENARRRAGVKDWREKEFLPAALEIAEAPPSPIGRAILWTIISAVVCALAWSILSFVDVVAVGEGRLVPTGRLRSVETAEAGIVRAIDVREGQHVTVGQPLIELDPTIADADVDSARSELATARLARARADAILGYLAALTARRSGAVSAALTSDENIARYEEVQPIARQQLTARQGARTPRLWRSSARAGTGRALHRRQP